MIRERFMKILQAGEKGEELSPPDLEFLLSAEDPEEDEALFQSADRVRQEKVGDEVHLRGIVEFSNICVQNCLYCGLRQDNRGLRRYRMTPGEILKSAKDARERGLQTVVLQSGEDPWFTWDRFPADPPDQGRDRLAITLSVGTPCCIIGPGSGRGRPLSSEAGDRIGPLALGFRLGRTLGERLDCPAALKGLGYEVGSGNTGSPQTVRDLVADILPSRSWTLT
jgi:biotin synthase